VSRIGVAVLGSPIHQSLSPVLHAAAYEALGLAGWSNRTVECTVDELGETLRALDAEGLAGVGLTMPLKRAVLPMLASHDERVRSTGAANTVVFGPDGWHGANTDVPGMIAVLRGQGVSAATAPEPPWIIGAGATAGSALAAVADLGWRSATLVARRPEATADVRAVADRVEVELDVQPWEEITGSVTAALVISTTPAGATDEAAPALTAAGGLLFDVIYVPWPTRFAAAWRERGGRIVGGLELLVEQAVEQVRLLTGKTPPVEVLRAAGYTALAAR